MTTFAKRCVVLAAFACLPLAPPSARAEAPMTVAGAWKVKSVTRGGKPAGMMPGTIFAEDAPWHFKRGGKATLDGWNWTWSYDADGGRLVVRRWGLIKDNVIRARVERSGADLKLHWEEWLVGKVEMTLTHDD